MILNQMYFLINYYPLNNHFKYTHISLIMSLLKLLTVC